MGVRFVAAGGFVGTGMVVALRFQRRVLDAQFAEGVLEGVDHFFRLGPFADHDVGGQRRFGGADRPDVQVMDAVDAGYGFHLLRHGVFFRRSSHCFAMLSS